MKSGSSSAVAFGRVLQAVRTRSSKNQADIAGSFTPKLSISAVSMAESGSRPPKTGNAVRGYADALGVDADDLEELWWATQGMVEIEDRDEERRIKLWWRELRPSPTVDEDHYRATSEARKARDPNNDVYPPSRSLFALAESICSILERLLGEGWEVRHRYELGLREPVDGRIAAVIIELGSNGVEGEPMRSRERLTEFACPEPLARPVPPEPRRRPPPDEIPPDVAWILAAVEDMPARERAAVAGFVHGLRQGASLYGYLGSHRRDERIEA